MSKKKDAVLISVCKHSARQHVNSPGGHYAVYCMHCKKQFEVY